MVKWFRINSVMCPDLFFLLRFSVGIIFCFQFLLPGFAPLNEQPADVVLSIEHYGW